MARSGVSGERKRAAALQAGRQMIARGQRPPYRVRAQDGRWTVDAMAWLSVAATSRPEALDAARAAIAAWLDVSADTFGGRTTRPRNKFRPSAFGIARLDTGPTT
jgi:hypothetical protein